MVKDMEIKKLNEQYKEYIGKEVEVNGWIRNNRSSSNVGFIDLNDGTGFKGVQIVYSNDNANYNEYTHLRVGSSITVKGLVQESNGQQNVEVLVNEIVLNGDGGEDYPIQPKRHTREFLREQAYLRPRTNLFNAVFRIRSLAAAAIHEYFQSNGFLYFNAPLITSSDCEGAGEMFQVTTLDLERVASTGKVDYSRDFFGKMANLTVSGQLEAETYAMAFSKVYTFGPTFRAENSNTTSHLAEFWMVEPEMAYCDINGLMDTEEAMLKYVINYVLEKGKDEMQFLDSFVEKGLIEKLTKLVNSEFARITHAEAIDLLQKSGKSWEFEPKQGEDIAKEHEKYLTEYFNGPVFIKDWPKDIKAFYMKQNVDGKTVAAVDLEVPGVGELMGGSQREEDYDKLVNRMNELGINYKEMEWYVNLRKYGTCVHSGFGLGFERLVMYLTGIENIRDVIPYYRTPNNCDF